MNTSTSSFFTDTTMIQRPQEILSLRLCKVYVTGIKTLRSRVELEGASTVLKTSGIGDSLAEFNQWQSYG